MKKKRTLMVGGLVLALTVGLVGVAQAVIPHQGQTVKGTSKPIAKPKFKRTKASMRVDVDTQYGADDGAAPPVTNIPDYVANRTQVDFDNDFVFMPGRFAKCNQNKINGTTTQQARAACRKAIVGTGSFTVRGQVNAQGTATGVVTAFNGRFVGGKPVILLHARLDSLNNTSVLVGRLVNAPGRDFGKRLDVNVPLLAGGAAAITHFHATVRKTRTIRRVIRRQGRRIVRRIKIHYVKSRCFDRNKRWNYRAKTTYDENPLLANGPFDPGASSKTTNAKSVQRCR